MFSSLFGYKRWANRELTALAADAQGRVPADEWRLFVRILNHTHVVDRIFAGHLQGVAHGLTATNTEDTPTLQALAADMDRLDCWYLDHVAVLNENQLAERIKFQFTDGDGGIMSRAEMLHHLIAHGAYHRGAAGRILFTHGIHPPRDSLTVFLHASQPERRGVA